MSTKIITKKSTLKNKVINLRLTTPPGFEKVLESLKKRYITLELNDIIKLAINELYYQDISELTEEDVKEIKEAREQYKNGNYIHFDKDEKFSLEKMEQKFKDLEKRKKGNVSNKIKQTNLQKDLQAS